MCELESCCLFLLVMNKVQVRSSLVVILIKVPYIDPETNGLVKKILFLLYAIWWKFASSNLLASLLLSGSLGTCK